MKIQVINYTFDKTAKTVTFTDYAAINLDSIYAVVNVTRNIVVYNPTNSSINGTVATNVLTLAYDTSAMANTDKLLIMYDDRANESTLIGSLTETAPSTDTASSGLSGRLQRIAQRITSLITALGSPFQAGGSIGNTSFAATQATAASLNMTEASAASILATEGATGDAIVAAGATGSVSAKLRRATQGLEDLKSLIVLAAGANAIGKLAANSGVNIGDVSVTSISAGTNLLGKIVAQLSTDTIASGTTALTPKFASINRVTNADGAAVVSIVSAKKIRVLTLTLMSAGTVSVKWQSSTSNSTGAGSNTDLTGLMSLVANTGMADVFSPVGLFETVAGEALKLNLNAAVQVSGYLTYVEV